MYICMGLEANMDIELSEQLESIPSHTNTNNNQ